MQSRVDDVVAYAAGMREQHAERDFVLWRRELKAPVSLHSDNLLLGELREVLVDWVIEGDGFVLDELEGANAGKKLGCGCLTEDVRRSERLCFGEVGGVA